MSLFVCTRSTKVFLTLRLVNCRKSKKVRSPSTRVVKNAKVFQEPVLFLNSSFEQFKFFSCCLYIFGLFDVLVEINGFEILNIYIYIYIFVCMFG